MHVAQEQRDMQQQTQRRSPSGEQAAARQSMGASRRADSLRLAAVVHYGPSASYCPGGRCKVFARNNKSREPPHDHDDKLTTSSPANERRPNGEQDDQQDEQQVVCGRQDTHAERAGRSNRSPPPPPPSTSKSWLELKLEKRTANKKTSNKFSRIFFTKNKSKHRPMIDKDNEAQARELRKCAQTTKSSSPTTSPQERASSALSEEKRRVECVPVDSGRTSKRVVEFKFDLIVEAEQGDEDEDEGQERAGEKVENDDDEWAPGRGRGRKILRPIGQRKLLDQVNELVESFVLDSMDVCLMTVGRRSARAMSEHKSTGGSFEYLLQSVEITLTYAFQLLRALGGRDASAIAGASNSMPPAATCSPIRADEHSVELEAWLLAAHGPGEPLEARDLLAARPADCATVEQALGVLEEIEGRLRSTGGQQEAHLMVNLKLKQQVQGGLFTNRMCLLDLGERPSSSQLKPVLESIFAGQALAYLKRQKVRHLHELELAGGAQARASDLEEENRPRNSPAGTLENLKHRHQVASARTRNTHASTSEKLEKLIQAEWLVYKQLSSALIKTLMIVHCHRLAPGEHAAHDQECSRHEGDEETSTMSSVENHLMEYNLNLLEFARAIRRASAARSRRRKRHLRSHLATTGSNLSLVSDLNNFTNTNTHRSSSGACELEEPPAHHHQDLMISSPFRFRAPRHRFEQHHEDLRRHERNCLGLGEDLEGSHPPSGSRGSPFGLPAHLLERYHEAYSATSASHCRRHRHRRQRECHHCHAHHHHLEHECDLVRGTCGHRSSRAASLNRRCSDLVRASPPCRKCSSRRCGLIGGDDETSSQLSSTSSGTNSSRLRPPSTRTPTRANHLAASDAEADSLATSTTLQSCGSPWPSAARRRDPSRPVAPAAGKLSPGSSALSVAAAAVRARQQMRMLALADESSPSEQSAGTLDDSIELQSFSSSSGFANPSRPPPVDLQAVGLAHQDEGQAQELGAQQQEVESELAGPVVAEPMRQLKLEQFLNQLTNFIGPPPPPPLEEGVPEPESETRPRLPQADKQSSGQAGPEEDDEDCRSHSSILEHLSSLTLESSLKAQRQQPPPQQQRVGVPRVSILGECVTSAAGSLAADALWPEGANGHLQQLLKSTLRLHNQKPLSLDCNGPGGGGPGALRQATTNESRELAARQRQQVAAADGFSPPSSLGSSSSASSSSASSSSRTDERRLLAGKPFAGGGAPIKQRT